MENSELSNYKAGIKIYLSEEDLREDKEFLDIETYSMCSGGLYSYRSVYRKGMLHRINIMIINELKEFIYLYEQSAIMRYNTFKSKKIDIITLPLTLEQQEQLTYNPKV